MLVLSRKVGESVVVGEGELAVVVRVVSIRGDKVRIGIEAPEDVAINREEVAEAISAGVSVQEINARKMQSQCESKPESRRAA